MADAMVTARMPDTKKEAGNRVLEELGSNASAAINELYDYLISKKQFPWTKKKAEPIRRTFSKEELEKAQQWMEGMQVHLDPEFANMTIKEAKRHRLIAKGLLKVDAE